MHIANGQLKTDPAEALPRRLAHLATMIDLTMLGMLTGRERTADELAALLDGAGFTLDRIVPTRTPMSVVEATLRR